MTSQTNSTILVIKSYIDENIHAVRGVNELVCIFCIDRKVLHEKFTLAFGLSPMQYIQQQKLKVLNDMIRKSDDNNISFYYAHAIGFQSSATLSNFIKRRTGLSFLEYRSSVLSDSSRDT
ncbi:AraC family transcriptional regulator [bacterium]|nr:AraC family transcriptional regulator [bacterium]